MINCICPRHVWWDNKPGNNELPFAIHVTSRNFVVLFSFSVVKSHGKIRQNTFAVKELWINEYVVDHQDV